MARLAASLRTTGAGSATLPMASIFSLGTGAIWVVEIGVTNTTVTAYECSLKRATALGTAGTAQTALYEEDEANVTAKFNVNDTHTVAPTLSGGELRRAMIGASAGSGIIWTFGGRGLKIPSGTGNGLCLVPITGTGQISDVYFSVDQ